MKTRHPREKNLSRPKPELTVQSQGATLSNTGIIWNSITNELSETPILSLHHYFFHTKLASCTCIWYSKSQMDGVFEQRILTLKCLWLGGIRVPQESLWDYSLGVRWVCIATRVLSLLLVGWWQVSQPMTGMNDQFSESSVICFRTANHSPLLEYTIKLFYNNID